MISPEDWKEYEWRVIGGVDGAVDLTAPPPGDLTWRAWRITATAGAVAGQISISGTNVTIPVNTQIVLEPRGMYVGTIVFAATESFAVEVIRRFQ